MRKTLVWVIIMAIVIFAFNFSTFAASGELTVEQLLNEFKSDDDSSASTIITDSVSLPSQDINTLQGVLDAIKCEVTNKDYYIKAAEMFSKNNEKGIKVFAEGAVIDFAKYDNVQPVIITDKNGEARTMIPARALSENLGGTVDWDAIKRLVTIQLGEKTIHLTLDSNTALVNGKSVSLDVPAQTIGGRTMIPLRFVSESFGKTVGWHPYPEGVKVISIYGN